MGGAELGQFRVVRRDHMVAVGLMACVWANVGENSTRSRDHLRIEQYFVVLEFISWQVEYAQQWCLQYLYPRTRLSSHLRVARLLSGALQRLEKKGKVMFV
jgi:hypothetical protein